MITWDYCDHGIIIPGYWDYHTGLLVSWGYWDYHTGLLVSWDYCYRTYVDLWDYDPGTIVWDYCYRTIGIIIPDYWDYHTGVLGFLWGYYDPGTIATGPM